MIASSRIDDLTHNMGRVFFFFFWRAGSEESAMLTRTERGEGPLGPQSHPSNELSLSPGQSTHMDETRTDIRTNTKGIAEHTLLTGESVHETKHKREHLDITPDNMLLGVLNFRIIH